MYIINFLPIASGGGLQNALSFLEQLEDENTVDYHFIVRKGSLLEDKVKLRKYSYVAVNAGLFNRLAFELTARKFFSKSDVCFTFFGPPILSLINYTYNINGFAYSNLLYPELDFWWFFPYHKKIRAKVIDFYRKYLTSFADEVIYETSILSQRASKDPLLKKIKSHVVKMAVSSLVGKEYVDDKDISFELIDKLDGVKLLFLAGAQPNKRIKEFINTLAQLNIISNDNFYMILTMDKNSYYYKLITDVASDLGIEEYIINIEPVMPHKISTLIDKCDALVNVALLESFSNNYIEAWKMRKPLIVTKADWALDCCGEAAVYIDISNPHESSLIVINLFKKPHLILDKIDEHLRSYPSSKEKNMKYLNIIKMAKK